MPLVAAQLRNLGDEHSDDPSDDHCLAESVVPAPHRAQQQHRAADHEGRESDRSQSERREAPVDGARRHRGREGGVGRGRSRELLEIEGEFDNGWARIDLYAGKAADGKYPDHEDYAGLVGLPTAGFAAQEFENNFLEGGSVKAYYGGLFDHRGNVRKIRPTHYYYVD